MLGASIIVFREMLEAALVISIVLAATKTVGGSRRIVALGTLAGLIGALVVALFADLISAQFSGTGQDVFNACAMILAVTMLGWHNIWMTKHGKQMASEMAGIGHAVTEGRKSLNALGFVVAIAVLREGSETVLFLWGIATSDNASWLDMTRGLFLGIAAGGVVSLTLYLGLLRIPTRHLFKVTTWLITLLAAGMAAQAVTFLAAAGIIEIMDTPLWDSSAILDETSIVGRIAHTLIGYMDRPNLVQLLAWAVTVGAISCMTRMIRHHHAPTP